MTDKQIIIDGYDVSLCEHFCKDDPCKNTCHYFCTPCEWVQIQNCMYKYEKRKEQECEELNKTITNLENIRDEFSTKLDQLKAENEELKAKLINWLGKEGLRQSEKEFYEQQLDKLKQTLTEIKEICNNNDELKGDFNVVDCDKYKLGKHNLANKILQKISEENNGR